MSHILTVTFVALLAQSAGPSKTAAPKPAAVDMQVLSVQVALDREGFSSGTIDGRSGTNTKRAIEAYRSATGQDVTPSGEPLIDYRITAEDAAGPFVADIPTDLMAQSQLPALSYRTIVEALAERFHTTPELLKQLNPASAFAADETIKVPNVEPMVMVTPAPPTTTSEPEPRPTGTAGKPAAPEVVVRVSRSASAVSVIDAGGRTIFFAPVTTGSERDPLPIGEWKVNGVQHNPPFRYNPDLFWDADPTHNKATIPPGPNGPVGLVWIDISKEHYGLHGTPEPAQIGRTQSHGCVRLTNWDALRLARLVRPGTKVVFVE